MQVFTWVSYGEIEVYRVDTIAGMARLLKHITDLLLVMGYKDYVYTHKLELDRELELVESTDTINILKEYRITINSLLVMIIGKPAFESGTGFKTLIEV